MITIFIIIYVIFSAFAIAGTRVWNDFPIIVEICFCIVLGWICFPFMIAFVFGKYINHLNDLYD